MRATRRRVLAAIVTISVLLGSAVTWAADPLPPAVEVELRALPPGGTLSVIVELADQADAGGAALTAPRGARLARLQAVVTALQDAAGRSQGSLRALLAQEEAVGTVQRVVPFWIFNGFAITATEGVIRSLAARPDVRAIRLDRLIPLPSPVPAAAVPSAATSEWNIDQIRAPEVWALNPNYTGVGSVVGSFDTGVDGTHPDLSPRYRGNHAISWFDPYGQHATPFDADGHGTHTTGTAVGGDAGGTNIGVAPGATWIAAKGWNDFGIATVSAFHEIFQWFLAPGGNPANAPDVVNNSWAFLEAGCDPEFRADIQAWRAAGIFPAFAAGNEGPGAGTVSAPGAYPESFAVGATDIFDDLAFFSGEGPSPCDGSIKPDGSAPGDGITSSIPGGYATFSGTSMATPHVTGAVAVLRSISPSLTVDELESALALGAEDLGPAGPDNSWGAGRLDLYVSAQIVLLGPNVPRVSVVATVPTATEAGLVPGAFRVNRTGSTTAALTVTYTVGGTATPGSDYVPLPGSVTIAAGSASTTIPVTPIDDPVVEFDETVVVTLAPSPSYIVASLRSATVTIRSDEIPPDLVVSAFTAPKTGGAGAAITLSDTTANQGAGAAGTSTTRFYLSTNTVLDAADTLLGSRAIPALVPGASSAGATTVTVPAGLAAGTYYLIAKADADNALVETQEGNNTSARSIDIGADLVVSAFTVPAGAGAGATITVTDTTQNQGGGTAGASTTRFYLSTDATLDAADPSLGSRAVPALAGGASSAATTALTIPASTAPGVYNVIVKADAAGVVTESQEGNNTSVQPIQIGPDLIISAHTTPATGGAGASISITDTTKNQGGGTAPASTTRFHLSGDATLDAGDSVLGSRSVGSLAPGASRTRTTPVTIPAGTAPGTYYIITKADADGVVAESNEGNNANARAIDIGPDLIVVASAPATAGPGTTISISDTTQNQGGGAAPATTTRFYLSTDGTLDAGDVPVGSRAVPALAPGASSAGTTPVTIPAGTAAGSYRLIAKADADNVVAESQEGNNTNVRSIDIGGPDLVVVSLTVPTTAGVGATITVTDTTQNQGGGTAGASTTRFYLSTDATLDAADVPVGSRAVPALAPGASSAGTTPVTIPAGTAVGSYYLIAKADADGVVAEGQEGNNTTARPIDVGTLDLVVSAFTAPAAAGAGTTISVSDTTQNQGGGTAPASTTRFYLSADTVLDAGDVVVGSRAVPALAPGVSSAGTTPVTIPAGTVPGTYYLIAKADADNLVAETQEGNNTNVRSIDVGNTDLVISAHSTPATGGAGGTIAISETTKNQGGGSAAASTTKFYLSTDATPDAGDVLLGGRAVPALASGATSAGTTPVTIPAGTAPGTYYLIAKADADGVVAESNEGNNTNARAIDIGPDLIVAASAPATAGVGSTFVVDDTTQNQGGGAAPASTTRFYLSTDGLLDAADVLLGSRAVPTLGPGASHSASTALTIPVGTAPGSYRLIAKADADGVVAESQEGNNTNVRSIDVGTLDLVLTAYTVPPSAAVGATISVIDTTQNQGGGTAPASTTRFYLSADTVLDAGDVVVGSRAVPALAPGASSAGTTPVTIPAGTVPGTYYLIAKADADNLVAETQEGNNTLVRTIDIGTVDLIVSSFTGPATATAGATISVDDTTQNQGVSPAGASTTRVYLSADGLLDAADVLVGGRAVPALGGGVSSAATTPVTIPAGTAAGTYYLIAKADADGIVAETQEGNNANAFAIQIGTIDIVISAHSIPTTAGAGATITVDETTKNQGGGTAGPSTTRFYLSADDTLDAGDVLLGGRAVPALGPGGTSAATTPVTIPAGTVPGTYYIITKADADGVVAETNEGNNTNARAIDIGPDLIVAASAPASATAGSAIVVDDTTRNVGGGAAGPSTTRFYLSADNFLDAGDVLLGSRVVPALGAGGSSVASTAVTIPPDVAAGAYRLLVKVDSDNDVVESQEGNNLNIRSIQITP